jgi:hypothetical protein
MTWVERFYPVRGGKGKEPGSACTVGDDPTLDQEREDLSRNSTLDARDEVEPGLPDSHTSNGHQWKDRYFGRQGFRRTSLRSVRRHPYWSFRNDLRVRTWDLLRYRETLHRFVRRLRFRRTFIVLFGIEFAVHIVLFILRSPRGVWLNDRRLNGASVANMELVLTHG